MLKRSLLVASVLGLASAAHAADTSITAATALNLTPEGVGAAGVVVTIPTFTITVGSDLNLNGKSLQIALDVPMVAANMPLSLTDASCATDDNTITAITYAGLTNSNKTANYLIASDDAENPAACVISVAGIDVAATDLTTAGIKATSSFTLIGSGVSESAATLVMDLTTAQYKQTVTEKASSKIDVNVARIDFADNAADKIKFTIADLSTAGSTAGATSPNLEITLTGDFSWADDPLTAAFDPTTARQSQTPIAINNSGAFVLAKSTTKSLVFSDSDINAGYEITITPLEDANLTDADATNDVVAVAIPVQTYTLSTLVNYTDASLDKNGSSTAAADTVVLAAAAAGGHALNGASTKIFAVPFGPEVESHSIFVSNSGTTTGAITGSMVWAGNDAVELDLGNVEAGANLYLNLIGALEAAGELPPYGRADITLTVNSPESDITFTAGYTTATGRTNLFMQQQANIDGLSSAASVAGSCVQSALSEGVDANARDRKSVV